MNIVISSTSGEPIYAQIVGQVRQMILQGELLGYAAAIDPLTGEGAAD